MKYIKYILFIGIVGLFLSRTPVIFSCSDDCITGGCDDGCPCNDTNCEPSGGGGGGGEPPCSPSCGSCTPPNPDSTHYDTNSSSNKCTAQSSICDNKDVCIKVTSCQQPSHCGASCGRTYTTWYFKDTNSKPTLPSGSNHILTIDNLRYYLNKDNTLRVKFPSKGNTKPVFTPPVVTPNGTNRGVTYVVEVNNSITVSPGSRVYASKPSLAESFTLSPHSQGTTYTLTESFKSKYYCINAYETTTYKSSYKVDNLPYLVNPSSQSNTIPDISNSITDVENNTNKTNMSMVFSGTSLDSNTGCKTTTYTGRNVNNTVHVKLVGKDKDGAASDIKAAVLMLYNGASPEGSMYKTAGSYSSADTKSDPKRLGLMVVDASTVYALALNGSNLEWRKLTNTNGSFYVNSTDKKRILQINNISYVPESNRVTYTFDIKFLYDQSSALPEGIYGVYPAIVDQYQFMNGTSGSDTALKLNNTTVDTSYITKKFIYGIDLKNPDDKKDLKSTYTNWKQREFSAEWSVNDGQSGIESVVVNIKRLNIDQFTRAVRGKDATYNITSTTGRKGHINPFLDTKIGSLIINELDNEIYFGGRFNGVDQSKTNPLNAGGSYLEKFNITNNEYGKMYIYVRSYDKACNYTDTKTPAGNTAMDLDFDAWYISKGSNYYSGASAYNIIKDISVYPLSYYQSVDGKVSIRKYDIAAEKNKGANNTLDSFTGLFALTQTANSIKNSNPKYSINHSAIGENIYNEQYKTGYYYSYLTSMVIKQSALFTQVTSINNPSSATDLSKCTGNCMYRSSEDIVINESNSEGTGGAFTCKRPTLIIGERDIIIYPDVVAASNTAGCIFLAQGDIIIKGGSRKSTADKALYDYLYGFLIAEGQIIIEDDIIYSGENAVSGDGLEIIGGLVAFGSNGLVYGDAAIVQDRDLRVFNNINPALVVVFDPRYTRISETFFGETSDVYKQDVGFKL